MDVQASYVVVCPEHDHVIKFHAYPDGINVADMPSSEIVDQSAYSEEIFLPSADYIGLKGDIKIEYNINSLGELTRLKGALSSHTITYDETPDMLTVYLDFDDIEPNVPTECVSPWASPIFTRTVVSNTKDSIFVRILKEGNFVKTKYKLTEPLYLTSSTTKHVLVFEGSCTINGHRIELSDNKQTVIQFDSAVSIVPDTSSLVVVLEDVS